MLDGECMFRELPFCCAVGMFDVSMDFGEKMSSTYPFGIVVGYKYVCLGTWDPPYVICELALKEYICV